MTEHNTPQRNTRVYVDLGDDATPWTGFHQGGYSRLGEEWFTLYLDAPDQKTVAVCLTPKAVLTLAKQLDEIRSDAEALLHAEAVAEGRAVA